jgi:hypothetical protein
MRQFATRPVDDVVADRLLACVSYVRGAADDPETYERLQGLRRDDLKSNIQVQVGVMAAVLWRGPKRSSKRSSEIGVAVARVRGDAGRGQGRLCRVLAQMACSDPLGGEHFCTSAH